MADYMLTEKPDGTIEFWTNDKELRLRVSQNIADIADAIHSMEQLQKIEAIVSDCLSPCAITPTEGMIEIQKLLKEENIENLY